MRIVVVRQVLLERDLGVGVDDAQEQCKYGDLECYRKKERLTHHHPNHVGLQLEQDDEHEPTEGAVDHADRRLTIFIYYKYSMM